jgi:hypothetical protein
MVLQAARPSRPISRAGASRAAVGRRGPSSAWAERAAGPVIARAGVGVQGGGSPELHA